MPTEELAAPPGGAAAAGAPPPSAPLSATSLELSASIGKALGTEEVEPLRIGPSLSSIESSATRARSGASTHLRSVEFHTDHTPLISSGTGARERTWTHPWPSAFSSRLPMYQ